MSRPARPTRRGGRHSRQSRGPVLALALVAVILVAALAYRVLPRRSPHSSPVAITSPSASASASASSPAASSPSPSASPTVAPARVPKPRIVWKPIPFPAARKAQMAAYANEHYGLDTWRLTDPKVIVEHYTASMSFQAVWNTFANDVPDVEFHSLPADCAHFVIDTDGTIYQLVSLAVMCRHTVGLNWTAIGIEMVGTSDGQILADPAQLNAAIHLTAWLMQRFHIQIGNVIGHNESLDSPYHHELVAAWRCQTHEDWQHADMQRLRADVARYLRRHGLTPGSPWRAHPQAGC